MSYDITANRYARLTKKEILARREVVVPISLPVELIEFTTTPVINLWKDTVSDVYSERRVARLHLRRPTLDQYDNSVSVLFDE